MARNYFSSYGQAEKFIQEQRRAGLVNEKGALAWDSTPAAKAYSDYRDRLNKSELAGTKENTQFQQEKAEMWKHMQEHGRFYTTRSKNGGTSLHWEGTDAMGRKMKGANNFLGRIDKADAKVSDFLSASGVGLKEGLAIDNFTRNFAAGYNAILGKQSVRGATSDEKAAVQTFDKIKQAQGIIARGKDAFPKVGGKGSWSDPAMYGVKLDKGQKIPGLDQPEERAKFFREQGIGILPKDATHREKATRGAGADARKEYDRGYLVGGEEAQDAFDRVNQNFGPGDTRGVIEGIRDLDSARRGQLGYDTIWDRGWLKGADDKVKENGGYNQYVADMTRSFGKNEARRLFRQYRRGRR